MDKTANNPIPAIKKALRERMGARRASLTEHELRQLGNMAQKALMADRAWIEARQVALYVAMRGEVNTTKLLEEAWSAGKQVLLPRCRPRQPGYMDFVPCMGPGCLSHGHFGIEEPCPDIAPLPWESEGPPGPQDLFPDLLVLPGVAFDRQGYRLGYGGGYYDRALSHPALAGAVRVGLAYTWQVVRELPVEPWDCPVHALCTEEGMQWL